LNHLTKRKVITINYDQLFPSVLRKGEDGVYEDVFHWDYIYKSLMRECDIPQDKAEDIAVNVCRTIMAINPPVLTAPLIREITCIELLKAGLTLERFKYTRIGLPVADIDKLEADPSIDRIEFREAISDHVLEEWNLVKSEIKKLEKKD